ncbi:MAG: aryldialkylphosphatase [Chloroflexi bacterium]|nr:aryldialkylphosphatase [Chloroflexota bacterium]
MIEGHVVTVLGPRPADALGVVDAHEHLLCDSPGLPGQAFTDAETSAREVLDGKASGIGTLVEMTPIGLGRDPAGLRAIAEATGVPIIAASGYHRDAHYPTGHWVHDASVEELADRVVTDLVAGMHPADWVAPGLPLDRARAGAIKGGASYHHVSPSERRRLEAIGGASAATGAAILVHCEIGTAAHEIVDVLKGAGARTDRIALAHMDRNPDAEVHAEIAARGVTLEYDTVGRTKYHPDSVVLDLLEALVAAGHLDRLMLGLDLGTRELHRAYGGGPGLRYLMTAFAPRLRRRLGGEAAERILAENPARFYAVRPTGAAGGDG